MDGFIRTEQMVFTVMVVHVEAASQSSVRWTLDPVSNSRVWQNAVMTPDEVAIAAATTTDEISMALVRSAISLIKESVPSIDVEECELTTRVESMPNGNAEVIATGPARFLASEWDTTKRKSVRRADGV